jgi:hypothetical protein
VRHGTLNCGGALIPTVYHDRACRCLACADWRAAHPPLPGPATMGGPLGVYWRALGEASRARGGPLTRADVHRAAVAAGYATPAPPMPEDVKLALRARAAEKRAARAALAQRAASLTKRRRA